MTRTHICNVYCGHFQKAEDWITMIKDCHTRGTGCHTVCVCIVTSINQCSITASFILLSAEKMLENTNEISN